MCPSCGHDNPFHAVRCEACGQTLGVRMCRRCKVVAVPAGAELCPACRTESTEKLELGEPCPACGLHNPLDRTVCASCGADLPESTTGSRGAARSSSPVPVVPEPPLVGREELVDELLAVASAACDGDGPRVAAVLGGRGAGKTRVLDEVATRLLERVPGTRVTRVACRESSDEAYDPLPRILAARFALEADLDEIAQRIAVTRLVGSAFGPEGASWVTETAHLLGHLAGIAFPQSPVLRSLEGEPERFEGRLLRSLQRFVEADSKEAPRLWVIDDLHNANPEALLLLAGLGSSLGKARHCILVAGQPSLEAAFEVEGALRRTLPPLDDEAMARLFGLLLPGLPEPPVELTEAAIERAGGNPASMREIARLLLESGVVDASQTPWRTDLSKLAAADLPVSLEEALRARRSRLEPRDRAVLERAAVIGEVFWDEAVLALGRGVAARAEHLEPAQIWPDDSETMTLEATLRRLEEAEFIVPLEGSEFSRIREYAFRHAGLRDQVYAEIPADALRAYHLLAAQWIETVGASRGEQFLEQVAEHWERAGERHRAARAFVEAASHARARFLNQKAVRLYERGLVGLSDEDRMLRMEALHDLGSVYELVGDYDSAIARLTDMLRDAWTLVHRGKAGAALNKVGRIYRARGDYSAARAYLERGLALFRAADDTRGVASSLDDLGQLYWLLGHYRRALDHSAEALEIRRSLNDRRGEAVSLLNIGRTEKARGYVDEADACYREAYDIARTIGDRDTECKALNAIGVALHARGQSEDAIALWRSALELAAEIGDRRMQSFLLNNLGEVLTAVGDREEAERCLMDCEALAQELEDRRVLSEVYRNLGALMIRHNEAAQARDYLERSLRLARAMGSKEAVGLALRGLGELQSSTVFDDTAAGGEDKATYFLQAVTIFERLGNEIELANTLNALGTYYLERGDEARAREVLERARSIYERVDTRQGERIDATISELSIEIQRSAPSEDTQVTPIPGEVRTVQPGSGEMPAEDTSPSYVAPTGEPDTQPVRPPTGDTDPGIVPPTDGEP